MNDNWGYEDNAGQGENLDGPKALRDAYSALKKQNEDLNSKLTSFLEREEKQRVATVFIYPITKLPIYPILVG